MITSVTASVTANMITKQPQDIHQLYDDHVLNIFKHGNRDQTYPLPQSQKETVTPAYLINSGQTITTPQVYHNPNVAVFLAMFNRSKSSNGNGQSESKLTIDNPIAISLVELLGIEAEVFNVVYLFQLPCDRDRVVKGLLKIHKVKPYKTITMDLPTMAWLDSDLFYSNSIRQILKEMPATLRVKLTSLPSLKAMQWNSSIDQSINELTLINMAQKDNNLKFEPKLEENHLVMAAYKQVGINPVATALAGAIAECYQMQRVVRKRIENTKKEWR